MIKIRINAAEYEYDIHSLVKAFYPQQEVQVRVDDGSPDFLWEAKGTQEEVSLAMDIRYAKGQSDSIRFAFFLPGQETPALEGQTRTDFSDRRLTKNRLKQKLYQMLREFTGKNLPWGSLTGIRPVRIVLGLLEQGKEATEIRRYMEETYFTSEEKIDLALDVARRERELLESVDYENGYSLYIGIPFCPSTCLYCSFTSYPLERWAARVDEYLDALEKEICFTAKVCRGKPLNAVYIGGGTPTTLSAEQLHRLLTMIGGHFALFDADGRITYAPGPEEAGKRNGAHLLEFTVEAGRPDSITREKLEVLRKHGISRISINPQTMNENTLRLIGRQHTVQQVKDSFWLARELGFDNINMDLIVGLPEEGIAQLRHTMDELQILDPDNITVHSLAVKRAARLKMKREDYRHLHIENTWEMVSLTADRCRKMGLTPYYLYRQKNMAGNFENVGYAKPGKAGVYNILIMEEKQTIMALGAGAITKFVLDGGNRIERVENVKDLANYLGRVDEMIERKRKRMEELQWL